MSSFNHVRHSFRNRDHVTNIIEWAKQLKPRYSVTLTMPNNTTCLSKTQSYLNAFVFCLQKDAIGKRALKVLKEKVDNELAVFAVIEKNKDSRGHHIHLIICEPEMFYLRDKFVPYRSIKKIWKKISGSTNIDVQNYYENNNNGFFGYSSKELIHDDEKLQLYGWLD